MKELPLDQIICGDCLEVLNSFPDKSIDLVITDPFYGSGGRDGSVHLECGEIKGNRMTTDSFIWFVRMYSKELYRITKDGAHCYVFSDWRKYKEVQIAFETTLWELRSLIVWNKGNGMGEYWRSSHEFILFFTKSHPRKLFNGNCVNVLEYPPVRKNKLHPTQKPVELIEFLITASSIKNEVVFDPFVGSGTTCVAAAYLDRHYIGIDISPKDCEVAKNRLKQAKQKLFEANP